MVLTILQMGFHLYFPDFDYSYEFYLDYLYLDIW